MPTAQEQDNSPDALIEQGRKLFLETKSFEGLQLMAKAIIQDPENKTNKAVFVDFAAGYKAPTFDASLEKAVMHCLNETHLAHFFLFSLWHSLYNQHPALSALHTISFYDDYQNFKITDFTKALNNPFLCKALTKIIVRRKDIEDTLTFLRRACLAHINHPDIEQLAPFITALSIQCFLNEHVFYVSEQEATELKATIENIDQKNALQLLIISCYFNLKNHNNSLKIKETINKSDLPDLDILIKLCFDDPEQQEKIKQSLDHFGSINDETSLAVQTQYEENPYPLWLSCNMQAHTQETKNKSKGKKILIAGCGTGQQAAIYSVAHPNAEITAIDLSRSSLAYAKHKTQELGLDNIEFFHGDILELSALGRTFDFITCAGVLHHMKNPIDGLKSLKAQLAPKGIIKLGLYSEIARRNIVKVQNWVKRREFPATTESIRNFRHEFQNIDTSEILDEDMLLPAGFFTISECRDLFFHVQENRFTCLQIKDMLEEIGFDLLLFAPQFHYLKEEYATNFPDDPQAVNLEYWHLIEKQNPDMFLGMYSFFIAPKGQYKPGSIAEWLME